MKKGESSWNAEKCEFYLKRKPARVYEFTAQEERPCQLCGKFVPMVRRQKFCTACSMIPAKRRREMMVRQL